MKSRDSVWLLCLLVVLFGSCAGRPELEYRGKKVRGKNGVVLSARMGADPASGMLTLIGRIENRTGGSVVLSTLRAGLRSGKGYMNIPVNTELGSFSVLPSKSRSFTLEYKPVNDPQLYQRIRQRGDLSRKYSLLLDFIADIDGVLLFKKELVLRADNEQYQKYLSRSGRRTRLFQLQLKNRDAFIKKHLDYYKTLPRKKHAHHGHRVSPPSSMLISGEEIMVRNMIIKMVPYYIRNRLFIHLKVINRSAGLFVDLSGMRVSMIGKEYRPRNSFFPGLGGDKKKPGKVKIKLQRNGRLFFDIDYGIVPDVQQLQVVLPGLLDDNSKRVFVRPLQYRILTNR